MPNRSQRHLRAVQGRDSSGIGEALEADPLYAYLALRLPFSGGYNDTSPRKATVTKAGAGSIVNGAFVSTVTGVGSGWLSFPTNVDMNLSGGTTLWSIEFFLKTDRPGTDPFNVINTNSGAGGWGIQYDAANHLAITSPTWGGFVFASSAVYNDNAMNHWRLVHKADGSFTWMKNGAAAGVHTPGTAFDWMGPTIGGTATMNQNSLALEMDDFKIYKGVALSTAPFVPPSRTTT